MSGREEWDEWAGGMSGLEIVGGLKCIIIILQAIYKQGEEMPDSMDGWMCFSLSNEVRSGQGSIRK